MASSAIYAAAATAPAMIHRDSKYSKLTMQSLWLPIRRRGPAARPNSSSYGDLGSAVIRPAALSKRNVVDVTLRSRRRSTTTTTAASLVTSALPEAVSTLSGRDVAISLVVAVVLPLVLGSANAILNNPGSDFYKDLKKPSINPPNWAFGLAWGILYPVIGFASWLVWVQGGGFTRQVAVPLSAYAAQLLLNLLWPPIFFTAHKIGLALADIVALLFAAGATAALFRPISPLAANLFIPYLAWIAFASFLNYQYFTLNPTTPAPSSA